MYYDLNNPLSFNSSNYQELHPFFEKLSLIPVFGDGSSESYYFMNLIKNLTELSNAQSQVKSIISEYCFEGAYEAEKANTVNTIGKDPAKLNLDTIDFELEKYGTCLQDVINITIALVNQKLDFENAFLKIKYIKVGDEVRIDFDCPSPDHMLYRYDKRKRGVDTLVEYDYYKFLINGGWYFDSQGDVEKPRLYMAQDMFKGDVSYGRFNIKQGEAAESAVLHWRGNQGGTGLYGKPKINLVHRWGTEVKYGILSHKISATEIILKQILALESNMDIKDKKKVQKEIDAKIAKLTNEGDTEAKSMQVVYYKKGLNAPFTIPLDVNREKDYQEYAENEARRDIYADKHINPAITSREQVKNTLSGDTLVSIYLQQEAMVFSKWKHIGSKLTWRIFDEIANITGNESLRGVYISFEDKITPFVEMMPKTKVNSAVDGKNGNV